MPAARLTQIRLRNFKSIGPEEQTVDLKPLTVLIGRNNSGKSTVIQSLLLLKQTLEDPRPEVQLALQGNYVRATSLRELTHGWPEDMTGKGPEITLRWDTRQETKNGWSVVSKHKDVGALAEHLVTELTVKLQALDSAVEVKAIELDALGQVGDESRAVRVELDMGKAPLLSRVKGEGSVFVKLDHFIPYLGSPFGQDEVEFDEDDFELGRMFGLLYEAPLRNLKKLVSNVGYVSSSREEVPPYYPKPTSAPTRNMLPNGGNAAELLYGRQADVVHRAAMAERAPGDVSFQNSDEVVSQSLKEAVDDVLRYVGIEANVSFSDVQELGLFRMLFGRAPINHMGRGIDYILPVIVASLLSDPLLGQKLAPDILLEDYLARCDYNPTLALEELESHLHPKAQTRLANFLVALARSGRQLIVETHSDHLVRRLRGLIARSEPGSATEKWLLENINIVEVEQTPEGVAYLHQTQLTREGSIERWPADFMEESSDEERAIYFAAMEKTPPAAPSADASFFTDVPVDGKAE